MKILKSLGQGDETVYLYYYPNDKILADTLGVKVWECKIGMTATGDTIQRVESQCKTARHQEPVIALEIRTDNAALLESDLHRMFYIERIGSNKITGDEWFLINPQQVEDYYHLKSHESGVDITINNPHIIDNAVSLGEVVYRLRKQLKLRQEDLGVSRITVYRVESGCGAIQTDTLFEMINGLGCKLAIVPNNKM